MTLQGDARRLPLAIDLFCGMGGWTEGFLAEGYRVVGFDLVRFAEYPGELVLEDVLSLDGAQFGDAAVIVASPPCNEYSYRAMPWKRAKALAPPDNTLFEACFRIQREASDAAGRRIPLIVENVKGAEKWVGPAKWHYGSYYLWGDVPALMPVAGEKRKGRSNFHFFEQTGVPSPAFDGASHEGKVRLYQAIKNNGGSWFKVAHNKRSGHGRNPVGRLGVKNGNDWFGSGEDCSLQRSFGSRSHARKHASAVIAKIPFPLAQHIARCFKGAP